MIGMFQACGELEDLDLSNFNTSNATDMSFIFSECYQLKTIKGINEFKTDKVKNMNSMFKDCSKLENLPVFYV